MTAPAVAPRSPAPAAAPALDRRHFVAAAGAGLVVLALQRWPAVGAGGAAVGGAGPGRAGPAGAAHLAHLFAADESARAVGRAYLCVTPAERDREALARLLADGEPARVGASRTRAAELRATIARRIRDDFAHGRTTVVDGWVLSLTEARVCALAALTGVA